MWVVVKEWFGRNNSEIFQKARIFLSNRWTVIRVLYQMSNESLWFIIWNKSRLLHLYFQNYFWPFGWNPGQLFQEANEECFFGSRNVWGLMLANISDSLNRQCNDGANVWCQTKRLLWTTLLANLLLGSSWLEKDKILVNQAIFPMVCTSGAGEDGGNDSGMPPAATSTLFHHIMVLVVVLLWVSSFKERAHNTPLSRL